MLNYSLILGTDIQPELSIILNFEEKTITWQEVSIPVRPPICVAKEFFVPCKPMPYGSLFFILHIPLFIWYLLYNFLINCYFIVQSYINF